MSDISDYQARITAALERISHVADGGGAASAQVSELEQALADEKATNAQLEHRIGSLTRRLEAAEDGGKAEIETLRSSLAQLDGELGTLRQANAQLRALNAQLRAANETGVGEPHLINKAVMTELEAVRAAQASDRAEMEAILAQLRPIVGEGSNA